MKLSDEKVIEFLGKSSVKSFATMLDVLRYVDGKWMYVDIEYELLDDTLGDNLEEKVRIRVPNIRGITANAHERGLLAGHTVELAEGEFQETNALRVCWIEDRVLFLCRRFSKKPVDRSASYWRATLW